MFSDEGWLGLVKPWKIPMGIDPLVSKLFLNMVIDMANFPMKNGDVPWLC